jgi:hypothetical protein
MEVLSVTSATRDLIALVLCAVGVLLGASVAALAAAKRRPVYALSALSLAVVSGLGFLVILRAESAVNIAPEVSPLAQLDGIWVGEHAALDLHRNGSYACRGTACKQFTSEGKWERVDRLVVQFSPENDAAQLKSYRIVSYRGRLYLAPSPRELTSWDPALDFGQATASGPS